MSWELFVRNKLNEAGITPPMDQFAYPMSSQLSQQNPGAPNSRPQDGDRAFVRYGGVQRTGVLSNLRFDTNNISGQFKFDAEIPAMANKATDGIINVRGPFFWSGPNKMWQATPIN